MRVAIYARQLDPKTLPFVHEVMKATEKTGWEVSVYEPFFNYMKQKEKKVAVPKSTFTSNSEIKGKIDVLFSLGGDGTILDTVTLVQDSGIPVLGINTGRMGFLNSVSQEHFKEALQSLSSGNYSLDKRSLLRLETNRTLFGDVNYALNELTIHKKDSSSMITIHTYLNGEFLNAYWADGLIIATPSGSTGYSLSCGGPIIMPQSENFVITPIAPHNLNVRPVVVSDKNVISLEVEGRSQYFLASLDSRSVTIDSSVQLAVRKEDFTLNLVRFESGNFLSTLRTKLSWGLDQRK